MMRLLSGWKGKKKKRKRKKETGPTQSPRSKHNLAKYMAEAANILGVKPSNLLSKHPISIKYFETVLV
jgi:hypothetical protein